MSIHILQESFYDTYMLTAPAYSARNYNKYGPLMHQADTAVLHNDFYNREDKDNADLL